MRSEPESFALREQLRAADAELVSSVLLAVEGRRAARRWGEPASARADAALATVTLVPLDDPIVEIAGDLEPPEMRSLDSLHLATVLSLGEDVERVYCYDSRLLDAARRHGIEVATPS